MNTIEHIRSLIESSKVHEVFDYYDGPRVYSIISNPHDMFLIYWVDEDQEKNFDTWVYIHMDQKTYNDLTKTDMILDNLLVELINVDYYLVKNWGKSYEVNETSVNEITKLLH